LDGFTVGRLVVGIGRAGICAPFAERTQTWASGLLHHSVTVRLTPWRRNWRYGYALAGPAVVIGWRL